MNGQPAMVVYPPRSRSGTGKVADSSAVTNGRGQDTFMDDNLQIIYNAFVSRCLEKPPDTYWSV